MHGRGEKQIVLHQGDQIEPFAGDQSMRIAEDVLMVAVVVELACATAAIACLITLVYGNDRGRGWLG